MFYVGLSLFFIGFAILIGAFASLINKLVFLSAAQKAVGIVTDLKASRNSDNGRMYLPVVSFTTPQNRRYSITGSVASNPPSYQRGERVTILYLPKKPARAVISSFWEMWFLTLLCFILAGILGFVGFCIFRN